MKGLCLLKKGSGHKCIEKKTRKFLASWPSYKVHKGSSSKSVMVFFKLLLIFSVLAEITSKYARCIGSNTETLTGKLLLAADLDCLE